MTQKMSAPCGHPPESVMTLPPYMPPTILLPTADNCVKIPVKPLHVNPPTIPVIPTTIPTVAPPGVRHIPPKIMPVIFRLLVS